MMLPVLSGLRVIAVEQYGAGPYGSMQLADLGAEIIKIENPADGGDMARRVGPFFFGDGDKSDDSQFFHSFNRNKKSLTLDLKKPASREVLHRLAARSDALFDNLRGDLPAKLGLTYADLAPANPKIVCAHLSAYGRDALLCVLRRLFVVDQVMPEKVARLFRRLVEDMVSAGIDDDLEIGFSCDRLTFRGWCPVVFLANQDDNGNRWVHAVVTEWIIGDHSCNQVVLARGVLRIGREQRRSPPE